jgi:RND family efflux transporter MFP subunit
MARRRRWFIGTGALGIAAILLVAGPLNPKRILATSPVSVEEVRVGRFVREVTATGALKAVEATPVLVPVEADGPQKIGWLAPDGARVRKGDPVVLFDATEIEKTLADGRADRDTAANKIGKIGAENRRTLATLDLDLGLVRQELAEADDFAQKDPEIFSRNEIITSGIDRQLLEQRLAAAEFRRAETSKLGAADLALGEIERSKAEIRIRQAEKTMGALRVEAPHDGLLAFERNWRGEAISVGDTVFPGQKVAEIPDLSKLEAKVYVLEADAGGLKPGLPVRLVLEGYPGKEYTGKVTRVDAMAKTRHWRVPTKYFETILAPDVTDPALMKPGQAVRATVSLEQIENVLSIPRGSVFEKDGKRVVYRLDGRSFTPVEVTLGPGSPSRVVIEKGLRAGDRIALRDPARAAAEILQGTGQGGSGSGGGR